MKQHVPLMDYCVSRFARFRIKYGKTLSEEA